MRWPRLCVDGRMLGTGGTGVATYSRTLLAALRVAGAQPAILDDGGVRRGDTAKLLAAWRPWPIRAAAADGGFIAPDVFREAQVRFTRIGRLRRIRLPGPPGTMHWTYPVPLRIDGWRNLYTVHDAIPLTQPDLTPIDAARHRRLLDAILAAGGTLLAVTASAADDIEQAIGLTPGAIANLGQAVDPLPVDTTAGLPEGLLARNYFLAYGSIEPRKNLARLAAAHHAAGTGLPLVVAGPDGWQSDTIAGALAGHGTIRLPYLDRATLLRLIAGARAVLFPSLAEGFGLPVAEAMTLGTPVLTSRGGATEEVAGGAALLVDPLDRSALAAAIRRLTTDDALIADLMRRGQVQAAAWSIDAFADRLGRFHLS